MTLCLLVYILSIDLISTGWLIGVFIACAIAIWAMVSKVRKINKEDSEHMVQTHKVEPGKDYDFFLLYYLPETELTFTVDLIIEVIYDGTKMKSQTIIDQDITLTTETVADLSQVYTVEYLTHRLYGDELEIKINSKGLLDNSTASSDDKSVEIVKELVGTPEALKNTANNRNTWISAVAAVDNTLLIETVQIQKKIILRSSELKSETLMEPTFDILLTNSKGGPDKVEKLTLSLTPNFGTGQAGVDVDVQNSFKCDGLLTRTECKVDFKISLSSDLGGDLETEFTTGIIDTTKVIPVELKRKEFAKKEISLTFDDGVLTGHKIAGPSSFHGFISIPIEIGKAIMSIPGQLFSFKVQRIKDQTTLATEQLALINAQNSLKNAALGQEVALSKLKSDLQKNITNAELERAKFELSVATATDEISKAMKDNLEKIAEVKEEIEEAKAEIKKLKPDGKK